MIRVTKLADYGILLLTWLAQQEARGAHERYTAPGLAKRTGLHPPTVSKLLGMLARSGILASHRGAQGGYALARPPREISVAEIIAAIEGPIALTECLSDESPSCGVQSFCPTRANWGRINTAIRTALEGITLDEMARPQRGWRERMSRSLEEPQRSPR